MSTTYRRVTADLTDRLAWRLTDLGWALIHTADHLQRQPRTTLDQAFEQGAAFEQRRQARRVAQDH